MNEPRDPVDEVLDELHGLRMEISARFDHDPARLIAHLQELHHEMIRQGWKEAPPPPAQDQSAA
jgi:uncharacterized protein (DUF2249 family)